MPSPDDHLQELRRQRVLVQEQLAWIDRQIAAVGGEAKPMLPQAKPPPQNPAATNSSEIDALLESYRTESLGAPAAARRGCFFVFFAALAFFALGVALLYFYSRSHHPLPPR